MSETGERDGKKWNPRAEPVVPATAWPKPQARRASDVDPDDLAGWDDTTTVQRPLDVMLAHEDEPTMVHSAAELLEAAKVADLAATSPNTARGPGLNSGDEGHRQEALLPPKPTVAPPDLAFPPPSRSGGSSASAPSGPVGREWPDAPSPASSPTGMEMGRPIFAVAAVGLLAAAGASVIGERTTAIGVLIGAGFATLNLWAFTRLGRGLIGRRGAAWGVLAAVKLVVLFGGTFWVLAAHLTPALPFLLGYSALPVGIVLSQVLGLKSEFEDGEGSI